MNHNILQKKKKKKKRKIEKGNNNINILPNCSMIINYINKN